MVKIRIRLVGANSVKFIARIDFDPEMELGAIAKKMESLTFIPPEFQIIEYKTDIITDNGYPLHKIQHGDEIVVKHRALDNWIAYCKMIEEIENMTSSGVTQGRREIAIRARSHLSPLFATKFFVVYPELAIEELEINKNLNFLVHNTRKYLNRSVKTYFENLYEGRKIQLKEKSGGLPGIHLGTVVLVDETPYFYAKTLGDIPAPDEEIDFPTRPIINLLEIYVYLLLKCMGLGSSEVHVIPDLSNSERVYIGTKLLEQFRTASGVSAAQLTNNSFSDKREKVVVTSEMKKQLRLCASLLVLSDLLRNGGNYGVVDSILNNGKDQRCETGELKIIDFGINMILINEDPSFLKPPVDVQFIKACFEKWDIRKSIRNARDEMENSSCLKNNKSVNRKTFEHYYERLKSSLEQFYNLYPDLSDAKQN